MQLQKYSISTLPVLNEDSLSSVQKEKLHKLFNKISHVAFPCLLEQFVRLADPESQEIQALLKPHSSLSSFLGKNCGPRKILDQNLAEILEISDILSWDEIYTALASELLILKGMT